MLTLRPQKKETHNFMPSKLQTVTVIGSGTMGNGISHVFAQCGFNVNMMDYVPGLLK